MINYIEAKSILSKLKQQDSYFGVTYNMNLYRGCQHGCIYCDTRSECYGINDITNISVKQNALELLSKELAAKRTKATIGTGSMNDPYMPIERDMQLTRKALQLINKHKFPVHIITKSDVVVRDYDVLQEISKKYAAVSFTITCADDTLSQRLEPNVPASSDRFKAMAFLASKNIYVGITLMPVLPFINDTQNNIVSILKKAKDAGASYIIPLFGVTLRKGSRDYFYQALDKDFAGLKQKYEQYFGDRYECLSPNYEELNHTFSYLMRDLDLSPKMQFYNPDIPEQLSLDL